MRADFSRITYDPTKHYAGVLHQQGRVWLDADWNEDVLSRLDQQRRLAADLIGLSGAPAPGTGFQVIPLDGPNTPFDFLIGGGRFYAEGIECQCAANTLYSQQPDFPGAPILTLPVSGPLRAIVYLEVWRRLITYLEDDSIREIALGGPDTATRLKTVAQVKILPIDSTIHGANARGALPQPGQGTLTTLAPTASAPGDPCRIPDPSDFTGRENRLYRVEVHGGGDVAVPAATAPLIFQAPLAQDVAKAAQALVLQGVLTPAQIVALQSSGAATLSDSAQSERVQVASVTTSGGQTQITLGAGLKSAYATARTATLSGPGIVFQALLAQAATPAAQQLILQGALSQVQAAALQSSGVATLANSANSETVRVLQVIAVGGQTQVFLAEGLQAGYAQGATLTGGVALIKWSRDNAAFAVSVLGVATDRRTLTVSSLGRDSVSALTELDLVEISDDDAELGQAHGFLTTLAANPDPDQLIVTLADPLPPTFDVNHNMTLRRWDGVGWASSTYSDSQTPDLDLGDGVHIEFGGSDLRAGDYWQFTARTIDGSVGPLTDALPSGIARVFTPLAIVNWSNQPWYDLGKIEAAVQFAAAGPLQTLLTTVQQGGIVQGQPLKSLDLSRLGALARQVGTAPAQILTITNWLAQNVSPPNVQTLPTLVVEEDCRAVFPPLAPPVIRITDVRTVSPDLSLLNDSSISVDAVVQGLKFVFNDALDPQAIGDRPVCRVAIELPFPFPDSNATNWGTTPIGSLALTLGATLALDSTNRVLTWVPTLGAVTLLQSRLFNVTSPPAPAQVFAHLTLKGRFIWSGANPLRRLDGETPGIPLATGPATGLQLPSGDSRPGGDFEMWVRLLKSANAALPQIQLFNVTGPAEVTGGTAITGAIQLANTAASAVTINLTSSNPAVTFPSASLTIPAGGSNATFTANTTPVPTDTAVTLTAQIAPTSPAGIDGPHTLSVTVKAPVVQSFDFNPGTVTGGLSATGTITLTGPLPANASFSPVLESGMVLAGMTISSITFTNPTSATFQVKTVPVPALTVLGMNVSLLIGGGTQSFSQELIIQGGLASITAPVPGIIVGNPGQIQVSLSCQSTTPTTITLASSLTSVATLSNSSITILAGVRTQFVTVNGVAVGTATITATQTGLPPQTATVTVLPKPKETKEGKEHKDKDTKDKDKDVIKDKEGHIEVFKAFEGAFDRPGVSVTIGGEDDPIALIRLLASRIDELEGRLADARAFIRPEERPEVGRKAIDLADGDGRPS